MVAEMQGIGKHSNGNVAVPAAEKRASAIALRRVGTSFDQIALVLGFANRGAAFKAVQAGLREALLEAGSEELRAMEAERLDDLQASRWQAALEGDDKAYALVLQTMKQRAELLGLNAPVKVIDVTPATKLYDTINTPETLYLPDEHRDGDTT